MLLARRTLFVQGRTGRRVSLLSRCKRSTQNDDGDLYRYLSLSLWSWNYRTRPAVLRAISLDCNVAGELLVRLHCSFQGCRSFDDPAIWNGFAEHTAILRTIFHHFLGRAKNLPIYRQWLLPFSTFIHTVLYKY